MLVSAVIRSSDRSTPSTASISSDGWSLSKSPDCATKTAACGSCMNWRDVGVDMGNRYLDEFFSLRCSADVLQACAPVNNGAQEITEAMGMRRVLKDIVLAPGNKCKYHVLDLCAGNGLFGLVAVHTLPVRTVTAIDIRPRKFRLEQVQRYQYLFRDIYDDVPVIDPSIVCGIHACRGLALRITDIYLNSPNAKKLILMPCCECGTMPTRHQVILDRIPAPLRWVWYLADHVDGNIIHDNHILSARNYIIVAEKLL